MLRGDIVARRKSPTTAGFSTYLFYHRPVTRLLWVVIGPLHRAIAPYLLARAASTLTQETSGAAPCSSTASPPRDCEPRRRKAPTS